MKVRFTLGVLIAAMASLLAFASPALAKGGTTTTAGCAQINSWVPSVQTVNSGPGAVLDVGVFNGCVDAGAPPDKMPAVGMTVTDTATGAFVPRGVIMGSYGQMTYRFYLGTPTSTPPARTITVDVTKPNGQVQDSRSARLADLMQAALDAQAAQTAA